MLKKPIGVFVFLFVFWISTYGQISQNGKNDSCVIESYLKLANQFKTANLDTAFYYAKLTLKHARNYNDTDLLINSINSMAETQFLRSEYPECIELSNEMSRIYKIKENFNQYYELNLNVAVVYEGIGEYSQAIDRINTSIQYWKSKDDLAHLSKAYMARSSVWIKLESTDSARYDINKSIGILKNIDSLVLYYAVANNTRGNIYLSENKNDSALIQFQKAYFLMDSLDNDYLKVTCLNNLALTYSKIGQKDNAILYFQKTMILARKLKSNDILSNVLQTLSDFYFESGKYGLAYNTLLEYDSIRSLVYNDEKEKQFFDIETKYQAQKKQNEIEILQRKNIARELKLQQKNYTIWVLSAIIILLGLLLFLNIQRIRDKSERNAKKIESEILRTQISPNFIKKSLLVIRKNFTLGKNEIANDYLADFANLMRRILDNSRKKEIPLHEELENVKLYLEFEKERFDGNLKYEIIFDVLAIDTSSLVPPLILQPIIENLLLQSIEKLENPTNLIIEIIPGNQTNEYVFRIFTSILSIKELKKLISLKTDNKKIVDITRYRLGAKSKLQFIEWISEEDESSGVLIKLLVSCNLYEYD